MHRLIRHFDMQGIAVRVRIDRNGLNTHLAGRLNHAASDFTAIGDQDFLEHTPFPSVNIWWFFKSTG